jgi:hypothetical protein
MSCPEDVGEERPRRLGGDRRETVGLGGGERKSKVVVAEEVEALSWLGGARGGEPKIKAGGEVVWVVKAADG